MARKYQETPLPKPKVDLFTRLIRTSIGVEVVKELRFHATRRWRFDYAIPRYRIAIEVEGGIWSGGRHVRGKGFLGDMEKYNAAALMGWRVFRVTPDQLYSTATVNLVMEAVKTSNNPIQ